MRTPVPQTSIAQGELTEQTEQLAGGLAQLLVAEYRRRHPQHNQHDLAGTVVSRRGLDHTEPADREAER